MRDSHGDCPTQAANAHLLRALGSAIGCNQYFLYLPRIARASSAESSPAADFGAGAGGGGGGGGGGVKSAWSSMVVVAVDSDASYQDEDESEDEDDDEDDDAHLDP